MCVGAVIEPTPNSLRAAERSDTGGRTEFTTYFGYLSVVHSTEYRMGGFPQRCIGAPIGWRRSQQIADV